MTHKKLSARILSLVLTAAMVGTMMPSTVLAAEGDAALGTSSIETTTRTITAFDELGEGFEKSVPFDGHTYAVTVKLGTPIEEIVLPAELGVTVERTTTTTTPPAKGEVVDSGEAPKDTAPADEPTSSEPTGEPEDKTVAETPAADEPASTEPAEQTADTDTTVSDNKPASPSDAEPAPAPEEKTDADVPPADEPEQDKPEQDKENTVTEVAQETITVTWKGDRDYTPDQNSKVIYTPVLPDGYALADGVALPTIYVMVGMQARAATVTEQFNLPIGETYYFDLSSEVGNIGTINTAVPDTTLHYVPFTYAGTVHAYSLHSRSADDTAKTDSATADANTSDQNHAIGYKSDRSLFVADYNVSHKISWNALNAASLIFGKTFDTNYKLRSLSVGSKAVNEQGRPATNEWDSILNKSELTDSIKNWRYIYSWGQDTNSTDNLSRAVRGHSSAAEWGGSVTADVNSMFGWRPALEVLNPTTLTPDGLKAITLNLNGGTFNGENSINIVCAGDTFKAPSATGLTRPTDNTDTYFEWNTQADGNGTSYAVGASVPDSVTTLYAQWAVPTTPVNTWAGLQAALTAGGDIKLTENITANPSNVFLNVPADTTVILDLNGYTIDRGLNGEPAIDDGHVITIKGNLTVKDTSTNGTGVITGGNNTMIRFSSGGSGIVGGIYVPEGGVFTLESGKISGNTARGSGGGVFNDGTFTMVGGEISANTATMTGGGVSGKLTVGGTAVIKNNKSTQANTEKADNVALYRSGEVIQQSTTPLAEGASIGVTVYDMMGGIGTYPCQGVFTDENVAWETHADKFFSDNAAYKVRYNVGTKKLELVEGPSITVATQSGTATYGTAANPTFAVTTANFGGGGYPAFAPSIAWTDGSAPAGVTTAFSADKGILTMNTTAATPAGEYTFKVVSPKADGDNYESAVATLTVDQLTATITWTGTSFTYNGSEQVPTATVGNKVTGDDVTITVTGGETAVGSYTATASALTGTAASNYELASTKPTKAFTITAKTVTVSDGTLEVKKAFDSKTDAGTATGELGLTGVVGTEDVSVKVDTVGAYADANVGKNKTVTLIISLDGTAKGNYTLGSATTYSFAKAEITKVAYTGTAANAPDSTPENKGDKSITIKPVTPPTDENVEYAVSKTNTAPTSDSDWQTSTTFDNLDPNTEYFFFARVKENDKHAAGGVSAGTSITTDKSVYTGTQATAPTATKTHNTVTLNTQTIDGEAVEYGYSLTANGEITWQNGAEFTELTPNTAYFFFARVKENDTHKAGATSAGTAVTTKPAPTTVSGNVKDGTGSNLPGAIVTLVPSNPEIKATTDASGNYTLTDVPAGTYSLVVKNGDTTITDKIDVAGTPITGKDMQFLSGDMNTVVDSKPGAPDVAVGGMNDLLNTSNIGTTLTADEKAAVDASGSVELKFEAEKKAASDVTADKSKIEAIATGKKIDLLLDLSVLKTVKDSGGTIITNGTKITTLADLIEVYLPIPADLQGKVGLALYRVHNGTAQALNLNTPDGTTGEYYTIDRSGEFMTLYVKNFSTYALGYDAFTVTISGGGNGASGAGNYSNGDTVSIDAGSRSGYTFSGWTVAPSTVVLANPSSAATTFTMPSENVTLTAGWRSNGSGGDGDGGGGGGGSSYTYYYIKATAGPGGSMSTAERVKVRAGESAGFTITPDKGYQIEDVLVNGKSIGAKSYYAFTNVHSDQTIHATFKKVGHNNPQTGVSFDDVQTSDWFYNAVMEATANGWFNGTSDTTFSPNAPTSRGMIATILHRIENTPGAAAASFADVVSDAYYANGVAWAQEHGIVTGYGNGNYGPNDSITREQLASILYRYAGFKGYDVSKTAALGSFTDASSVSGYAKDSLSWAVGSGLISGRGNNTLAPTETATRAEVAVILVRFEKLFIK